MPRSSASPVEPRVPSRYRVFRLPDAKLTERGVLYRRGGQRYLLAWPRVKHAFAAEVGEPGQASLTLFDLAIQVRGPECVVCRLEAEPGEQAVRIARTIELAVGVHACSPVIRAIAADGMATRSYPDVQVFGEAVLEAVRFGGELRPGTP